MSNILFRNAELTPGTGRTVHGVAVPYGQVAEVNDGGRPYRERFEFGAFGRSIAERGHKVRLLTQHDHRKLPVGRALELREERDGLYASFEVARTSDGDDLLELVRSGLVDSFSVGFSPVRDRRDGDIVTRVEASLREVSAVSEPAYPGAAIAGVRSQLIIPRGLAEAQLLVMDW